MSVMADTSQLPIGPYVLSDELGFEIYKLTAVCRAALVVNTWPPPPAVIEKTINSTNKTTTDILDDNGELNRRENIR